MNNAIASDSATSNQPQGTSTLVALKKWECETGITPTVKTPGKRVTQTSIGVATTSQTDNKPKSDDDDQPVWQ